MPGIIEAPRSIVLAADMAPSKYEDAVNQVAGVEGIGGVKLGFGIALSRIGLPRAVEMVKEADSDLAVVYDHQKASTDIPATGSVFADRMSEAGVDAAILFPFTGPVTQEAWTKALQDKGVKVISGGEMTHDQIASSRDAQSGGYVHPNSFARMYMNAIDLGVRDFVVPGNKPDKVAEYKYLFDVNIGEGEYTLWAPGFLTQGGDVSETGAVAGPNFHAIVGSGIYKAENPREAAQILGQRLFGREE